MKLNAWLFIPNYHLTKDRVLVTGQKPDFLITDELSLEFIEYWTNARIHVHRGLLDFKNENWTYRFDLQLLHIFVTH